jgi:hypothetical protein
MARPRLVQAVWVVLTEDKCRAFCGWPCRTGQHFDVTADVFATEAGAIQYAESYAASVDADLEEISEGMARAGWIRYYTYGESSFSVQCRELKP